MEAIVPGWMCIRRLRWPVWGPQGSPHLRAPHEELGKMPAWLLASGCTPAAIELEGHFELTIGNALAHQECSAPQGRCEGLRVDQ
jgi:hypothetical protein